MKLNEEHVNSQSTNDTQVTNPSAEFHNALKKCTQLVSYMYGDGFTAEITGAVVTDGMYVRPKIWSLL